MSNKFKQNLNSAHVKETYICGALFPFIVVFDVFSIILIVCTSDFSD